MNLRRIRSMAKELGQTFHQTAMREGSELSELAYELADSEVDDEAAASRLRVAFSQQRDRNRAVAYCLDWLPPARRRRRCDPGYLNTRSASRSTPASPRE